MNSEKEFDFLVFIGRFQPFHNGHLSVINTALEKSQTLIILCGSAHQPRSVRNPWTVPERETMIRSSLTAEQNERVLVAPLMDIVYNDEAWVRNVQATINGLITSYHAQPYQSPKIGLIGHSKDQSSYYLNLFPQWRSVAVENCQNISATPIRESLLVSQTNEEPVDQIVSGLPESVKQWVSTFQKAEVFSHLKEEFDFIAKYKQRWSDAPYTPTFLTVDAVVVQSGHVLMVERKAKPGKGLMALPGGFVQPDETLIDACIRELREETKLKIPPPVLKGSIKKQRVFDDPHRSSRGRTITHAYYIELEPNQTLPKVKGSDDAKKAFWVPLAELNPEKIFEDHYFIIHELAGM